MSSTFSFLLLVPNGRLRGRRPAGLAGGRTLPRRSAQVAGWAAWVSPVAPIGPPANCGGGQHEDHENESEGERGYDTLECRHDGRCPSIKKSKRHPHTIQRAYRPDEA